MPVSINTLIRPVVYILIVIAVSIGMYSSLDAQIAVSGSRPYSFGVERGQVRSALFLPTLRLGGFDQDSALMSIESSRNELLRTQIFAHKQLVDVDLIKESYTGASTADTKVWQYRVVSSGAKSIGLLLDDFYLPDGALLFVYSTDHKQVIGGFGSDNNNDAHILPIQPIFADDITIEVTAPASGKEPKMRLKEVNHGLIDIRGRAFGHSYKGTDPALACTPEVVCIPNLGNMPRSVVLLVFDGIGVGTGAMINNTKGDLRPLLLTAAHVPSANFTVSNYESRIAKIQAIFNYQSSSCSGEVQPSLTQSISGGKLVAVDEGRDICLIELNNTPPPNYKAYYAGWNAEPHPKGGFTNIHHPSVQPKCVNFYYGELRPITFPNGNFPFEKGMHWEVKAWDVGTTAPGSSGSPLFDKYGRIVGGLSGGRSYCGTKDSDYFFSLNKVWDSDNPGSKMVVQALDPSGQKRRTCEGSESSMGNDSRFMRISHINEQFAPKSIESALPQIPRGQLLGQMVGASDIQERYMLTQGTEISGVFIMFDAQAGTPNIAPPDEPLELQVYLDDEQKTAAITQTLDIVTVSEPFISQGKGAPRFRELYVPFTKKLVMPHNGPAYFSLNVKGLPKHMSIINKNHNHRVCENTLFWHVGTGIIPATEMKDAGLSASLWIDPVVYSKSSEEYKADVPLVMITPLGSNQVLLTFPQRTEGKEKHISMYTLLGQRFFEQTVNDNNLTLNRKNFEGHGIFVLQAQCGSEKLSIKVFFPSM